MTIQTSTALLAILRAAEILGAIGTMLGGGMAVIGWLLAREAGEPGHHMGTILLIPGLLIAVAAAVLWGSAYVTRRLLSPAAGR